MIFYHELIIVFDSLPDYVNLFGTALYVDVPTNIAVVVVFFGYFQLWRYIIALAINFRGISLRLFCSDNSHMVSRYRTVYVLSC
jgi:hypothetical protein